MKNWKTLRRRVEELERQVPQAPEEEPTDEEWAALTFLRHELRREDPPDLFAPRPPITDAEWAAVQKHLKEHAAGAANPEARA